MPSEPMSNPIDRFEWFGWFQLYICISLVFFVLVVESFKLKKEIQRLEKRIAALEQIVPIPEK